MKTVSKVCRKCGAEIFADAPEGVCSVCLFQTGLDLLDDEGDEAFEPTAARMLKDFGDYELLEEIGRGGQGVVYRARQKSLNRIVALKVIGLAHWATEAHVKRFRMEAEAVAHLDDPRIVPIYEIGERDGACYFSMKFIEGGQLDTITASEVMPLRKAAELMAKLARTVHYAHEHGILHRDIKPGNIMVDRKGEPHLTDFGLARLVETESTVTRTLEVLGTPSYKCLEKNQERRYSSALELAEDLERWLKNEPIRARPTGLLTRGRKWMRRNPTTAVLVASLAALAAVVGAMIWKSDLVHRQITTELQCFHLKTEAKTKPTPIWSTASRMRF